MAGAARGRPPATSGCTRRLYSTRAAGARAGACRPYPQPLSARVLLLRSPVVPCADFADLPCPGRLSGDELVEWLVGQHGLREWWLCYDASAALLASHPTSCLAHHLGVELDAAAAAMDASGLIGRGVSRATRAQILRELPMHTSGQVSFNSGCAEQWCASVTPVCHVARRATARRSLLCHTDAREREQRCGSHINRACARA